MDYWEKLSDVFYHSDDKFRNLFHVDSISLVLGANGSGKTNFLLNIINHFEDKNDFSKYADTEVGIVYYTSLPYLRDYKIRKNDKAIYYCSKSSITEEHVEAHNFLSDKLSYPSYINVNISISRNYLARKIILFLVDHYDVLSQSNFFDKIKYKNFKYIINQLNEIRKYPNTHDNLSDKKQQDKYIDELRAKFTKELEYYLFNLHEKRDYQKLCTLEYMLRNNIYPNEVIFLYLKEFFDIGDFLSEFYSDKALDEFSKLKEFNDKLVLKIFKYFPDNEKNEFISLSNYSSLRRDISKSFLRISSSSFSAGSWSIIDQFAKIRRGAKKYKNKDLLVLIDECDAYLHLGWQKKYINLINDFFCKIKSEFNLKTVRVVVATHSLIISTEFPSEMIIDLDNRGRKTGRSFASPLDLISKNYFGVVPIGDFAKNKIKNIIETIESNLNLNDIDLNLINALGDEILRKTIKNKLEIE